MGCNRGAASPNMHTQRRLFAASAGYCQNPSCTNQLFIEICGESFHIAEMAHVFAANDGGPRSNSSLSKAERGSFDNLIVLCANCHTAVDKSPTAFPDAMMLHWKREHSNKIASLFGAKTLGARIHVREAIEPLLAQNHATFSQYGPHIAESLNPESGAAETWKRKMLTIIIPTNRRILAIVDANRTLLRQDEMATVERFRQHVDDIESFHIEGVKQDASQFPHNFHSIFED